MFVRRLINKIRGEEEDDEIREFRRWLHIGLMFLFVTWLSMQEFRYLLFSRETEATVTERTINPETDETTIHYRFQNEKNESFQGRGRIRDASEIQNDRVRVVYLPGKPSSSRLTSETHYFVLILFFLGIGYCGFSLYGLAQEANQPFRVRK